MKTRNELKDLHGEEYVDSYKDHSTLRLSKLVPYMTLRSGDRVVDFACGNGLLMELIASRVESYVGVDFSEAFIAVARERQCELGIDNATYVCSDLNEFCQQNPRTFDVAFAMDLSQHVYDDQWVEILGSIHASLKPQGTVYIHTPNSEFFLEKMKNASFILKQRPQHVAPRNPSELVSNVQQAGFQSVRLLLVPHYNILRLIHPLSFVPVIGKYFKARIFIEAKA